MRPFYYLFFALVVMTAFLWPIRAHAAVIYMIDNPTQSGLVGDVLHFTGAVVNTGPEAFSAGFGHSSTGVWPNEFELEFPAGISTNSGFSAFRPAPGDSFSGVLFDIVITPAAAGRGIVALSYLYSWPDGSDPHDFNAVVFSNPQPINVTVVTPEPNTLWCVFALTALMGRRCVIARFRKP